MSLALATGTVLGKGRVRLIPYGPPGGDGAAPYQLEYAAPETGSTTDVPDPVLARVTEIIAKAGSRALRSATARSKPSSTPGP